MVDVSRHSTFPPLLGRYNSQIDSKVEPTSRSYQASAGMRSRVEQSQASKPRLHKRRAKPSRKTKAFTVSVESISKKMEGEAKQKRNEKAETTLKVWDTLLRQDKEKKYQLLQQRVKVQRELIGKNDELFSDLRTRAEEDRLEKIQSKKDTRKEVVAGLQAHFQRVEEHKKMISKKIEEIRAFEEGRLDSDYPLSVGREGQDVTHSLVKGTKDHQESDDSEVSPRSSAKTQAVMLQLLGIDGNNSNTIDTMWGGWKADAIKKITPVVRYSDQLKQVASPSVRQCLEIYEQPTSRDRFTGKPIPLSDILGERNVSIGDQYSTRNSALEVLARQTQKRAEIMLGRKNPFQLSTCCNPEFYLSERPDDVHLPPVRSKSATTSKTDPLFVPKRCKTGTSRKVKKQLPSYLTHDGDLCSGSLEEFGDQFYCAPSRTKSTKNANRSKEVYGHSENSVFLTDLHGVGSPTHSASSSHSDLPTTDLISKGRTSSNNVTRWQPLCTSALTEHSKVTEVPVSGLGHLAHGRYSMWKPKMCVVHSDDSFSDQ